MRYLGLAADRFEPLFDLSDDELRRRGMRRMIVDSKPGFPCRVTLQDAEPGERVLLLPFDHQTAHSPFRASGPVFVREGSFAAYDASEAPPVFKARALSVRAYDAEGMMLDADLAEGEAVEKLLARFFHRTDVDYIHIHFARRGCFACRVER